MEPLRSCVYFPVNCPRCRQLVHVVVARPDMILLLFHNREGCQFSAYYRTHWIDQGSLPRVEFLEAEAATALLRDPDSAKLTGEDYPTPPATKYRHITQRGRAA